MDKFIRRLSKGKIFNYIFVYSIITLEKPPTPMPEDFLPISDGIYNNSFY